MDFQLARNDAAGHVCPNSWAISKDSVVGKRYGVLRAPQQLLRGCGVTSCQISVSNDIQLRALSCQMSYIIVWMVEEWSPTKA